MAPKPYRQVFSALTDENHIETSPTDNQYNCIGHAAGSRLWWWPADVIGGAIYWPPGIPRDLTIEAFISAYATIGYADCGQDGRLEEGFEKVAIYAKDGVPQHAARQLDTSYWTSKLGRSEDISHHLEHLEGEQYGNVVRYLKRPRENR
jgi:hypothetical protein